MKKIEREEENAAYEDPDKKTYHLCIVNLVIGTLYCAKGNYQVGNGEREGEKERKKERESEREREREREKR